MGQVGKLWIVGVGVAFVGSLLWALSQVSGRWLGDIPGDFAFGLGGGWVISVPLGSMLLVGAAASLVLFLLVKVRR